MLPKLPGLTGLLVMPVTVLTGSDIATAYLTAHMLKVQANIAAGAGSGSVSKRKTGDVEEHYAIANINPLSAPYSLTEYGIEFKNLSDNIFIEPFYV
jgi:hypothetical protein